MPWSLICFFVMIIVCNLVQLFDNDTSVVLSARRVDYCTKFNWFTSSFFACSTLLSIGTSNENWYHKNGTPLVLLHRPLDSIPITIIIIKYSLKSWNFLAPPRD